jgi:hypothetical protein
MKRLLLFLACTLLLSSAQAQTPVRIACGQTKPFTDSAGNVWAADTSQAGSVSTVANAIKGTSDPALYQRERWTANDSPALIYTLAAPAGNYTLSLHFAETYFDGAGLREFNVKVNGGLMLTNYDIFTAAGGQNVAVTQSFPITSTGSVIVEFDHGATNNPKCDAIELVPAIAPLPNIPLAVQTPSFLLFDDATTVYAGPISVTQSSVAATVTAGVLTVDALGNLSGTISVNPNASFIDSNGNMSFLFSIPGLPGYISQTLSAAEFQQGATGITFSVVIYKAPLITPKAGAAAALVVKSFAVGLTP